MRPTRSWTTVRRFGSRPSAGTPQRSATWSPHAPAALTRIAGLDRPGAGFDLPAVRACAARDSKRCIGPHLAALPPDRAQGRHCGRRRLRCRRRWLRTRRRSIAREARESAGRARRDRDGRAHIRPRGRRPRSNASPHGPVRCTAPRVRSSGVSLPGQLRVEHRLGRQAQPPLRRVAAKAGLPEGGRPPGGVTAAHIFGFDHHDAASAGQPRAKACAGDSAADDQDITLSPSRGLVTVWKGAASRGAS